jgi:hypothetical protein
MGAKCARAWSAWRCRLCTTHTPVPPGLRVELWGTNTAGAPVRLVMENRQAYRTADLAARLAVDARSEAALVARINRGSAAGLHTPAGTVTKVLWREHTYDPPKGFQGGARLARFKYPVLQVVFAGMPDFGEVPLGAAVSPVLPRTRHK